MPYVKRIVCLANSFKIGGSCIAGREVLVNGKYGGWIRPVSARATAEVSSSECKYQNNSSPKLLDIIDVPLLNTAPHNHQTENHVIDAKTWWVKRGELRWDDLEQLRERPESLWINSDHTSTGAFNCISQAEAATLHDSLVLIKKNAFTVQVGSKDLEPENDQDLSRTIQIQGRGLQLEPNGPRCHCRIRGKGGRRL